jgi:6-phosphofructokinase 2
MVNIITLTINPTIDKSTSVESVASEIKLRCDAPQFHAGGGGINVSRVVKRLGGDPLTIYTVGGGTGQHLVQLLDKENLRSQPIPIAGMTRENLTVYERSSGLQYRFGMPGPEINEWQACIDACFAQPADYIVASGSLAPIVPEDFYKRIAERAKGTSTKVIVDTSGKALEACAQAGVYMLKPNLEEIQLLSGKKFETEEALADVVQELIHGGMAQVFVISMGASGAMMVTIDDVVKMRPPVVPVKSKVGAGDSMVAGIVWALSNGEDLRTAVRYGIASGSATVMQAGTQLAHVDDVMRIVKRIAVVD